MNFVLVVVITLFYAFAWYFDYKTFDRIDKRVKDLENVIKFLKGENNEV